MILTDLLALTYPLQDVATVTPNSRQSTPSRSTDAPAAIAIGEGGSGGGTADTLDGASAYDLDVEAGNLRGMEAMESAKENQRHADNTAEVVVDEEDVMAYGITMVSCVNVGACPACGTA